MDASALIWHYQAHLVDALVARIAATEAAVGPIFAFNIQRRGMTTLVVARNWPDAPRQVPFHRIYNYTAPEAVEADALLADCVADQIDVIVEAGIAHRQNDEVVLRRYHFSPQWAIAWLHCEPARIQPHPDPQLHIRRVGPDQMDAFATLFVQGYGYEGAQAEAWHTFARHGYTAPGFHCFVADVDHTPAGFGVLHIKGTTALVDGAATLPHFRGLGVHKALLTARIDYAQAQGCTQVFSRTGAGSLSQQNMEKLGFQEMYRTGAWRRSSER